MGIREESPRDSSERKKGFRLVVLGTPEWEARHLGRVPEILNAEVVFVEPTSPERIVEEYGTDVLIVSREWTPAFRVAVAAANRAGVPTVYIMDGILEWSYVWKNLTYVEPAGTVLQPLMSSDLCVIGQHPARILASMGLADRIHVVGLPRLDGVAREEQRRNGKPRVLIATARTFGHDVEQQVEVRRALRDLKAWFDANDVAIPVWRIAEELCTEIGVEKDSSPGIAKSLSECSALISFASTVLLEGMAAGLPTAVVDYRPVPMYVATAWEIRSAEHVGNVVHELLYPPAEKLAYQDACLRDELELGGAEERLARVLQEAAARTRQPLVDRRAQPSEVFGKLDYRQIHSQLSAFAEGSKAVLQYELDAAYKLLAEQRERADHIQYALDEAKKWQDKLEANMQEVVEHRARDVEALQNERTTLQLAIAEGQAQVKMLAAEIEHREQMIRDLGERVASQDQTIGVMNTQLLAQVQAIDSLSRPLYKKVLNRLRKRPR